jgi:carbon-monoxide dehydrogenase medium subunit
VKPAAFEYHAPASAQEAVTLLAELGDGAKVIAGGQSLVPVLAMRLAVFDHLVDVRRVAGMAGIERRNGSVWIGAGTTQAAIGTSDVVASEVPLLAAATPLIGHFQIRNRGTIGGSLAHADPAAEYPAVARALDAVMHTRSPRGPRAIPAEEFFAGIWTTALEPDELLTAVEFPAWGEDAGADAGSAGAAGDPGTAAGPSGTGRRSGHAVEEFARRPGDFAIAGAAVAVEVSGDPAAARVTRCGIGLFGLGSTPLRALAAEALVLGRAVRDVSAAGPAAEIGRAAVAELASVPADMHAPADYRKRIGAAVVAAAWKRALAAATGTGTSEGAGND